jgi:hypothetical protein
MFLGCIGGIATGISHTIFNFLFGQMPDALNNKNIINKVNTLCIALTVIAVTNLFTGLLQVDSSRFYFLI